MDAALAGLIGASIGAIASLLGGLISGWQQRKGDAQRWYRERATEVWKEERRSLLELTTLLAEGAHAVSWLCWAATAKPDESLKADVTEYDAKMRQLLPRLVSAQAAASGLSDESFENVDPLVQQMFALDTQIGDAAVQLDADSVGARERLRGLHESVSEFEREIVVRVRSLLRLDRGMLPPSPAHPDRP
jgi:gas vesicle protein